MCNSAVNWCDKLCFLHLLKVNAIHAAPFGIGMDGRYRELRQTIEWNTNKDKFPTHSTQSNVNFKIHVGWLNGYLSLIVFHWLVCLSLPVVCVCLFSLSVKFSGHLQLRWCDCEFLVASSLFQMFGEICWQINELLFLTVLPVCPREIPSDPKLPWYCGKIPSTVSGRNGVVPCLGFCIAPATARLGWGSELVIKLTCKQVYTTDPASICKPMGQELPGKSCRRAARSLNTGHGIVLVGCSLIVTTTRSTQEWSRHWLACRLPDPCRWSDYISVKQVKGQGHPRSKCNWWDIIMCSFRQRPVDFCL